MDIFDESTATLPGQAIRQQIRVLISGGGTGGHIYPALAVARRLQQKYAADILYIGDESGLETRIVPEAGFQLQTIHAGRLLRYWSRQTVQDLIRVPRGFVEAQHIIREFAPHVAFTSGGYVAVPAGIAARRQGIPLLIHQQDVSPNLANRLLKSFASTISVSFKDSMKFFPADRVRLVGNPVRDEIIALANSDARIHKRNLGFSPAYPLLVVTGGSQGAKHINEAMTDVLPEVLHRFQVLHISGDKTFEETSTRASLLIRDLPEHVQDRYKIVPYLNEEMAMALAAADLVIARAGAATLAELAILGKPSILVPLPPGFSGSPQEVNAMMFASHGAAQIILDKDLTAATLHSAIDDLFLIPDARIKMTLAAKDFARPQATFDIADMIIKMANEFMAEQQRQRVMRAIQKASR